MTATAVQAGARLHHIALESADPQRLAEFHANAMDMSLRRISDSEWHCLGPDRRTIFVSGENRALAFAGFACRDEHGLESIRVRAARQGVELLASPSPWLEGNAFGVRDPDGRLVCFGLAPGDAEACEGIRGPLQHVTYATFDVDALLGFYQGKLGFRLTDRVYDDDGRLTGCFMTSTREHHTVACFRSSRQGLDHYCHEAGEWNTIRDWCDHFAARRITLVWGPGRHGPGNNLFAFIRDPDGNMIEVSAELEQVDDRPVKDWRQEPRTLNLWGAAIDRQP